MSNARVVLVTGGEGATSQGDLHEALNFAALHRLPVVLCLDRAGITGDDGASHHGVYDLALLAKVPGMRVLAPSSAQRMASPARAGSEPKGGSSRAAGAVFAMRSGKTCPVK